jgi:spermidine synthase
MLVTVFLAGLLPGAWLGSRANQPAAFLFVSDMAIIAMMLACVVMLHALGDHLPALFYYGAGFLIATACGFQIPLALTFLGDDNPAVAHIFSVDLVGAAFGALATSTIFIPYLGLGGSIAVLIAIKLFSLLFMGERYAAHRST